MGIGHPSLRTLLLFSLLLCAILPLRAWPHTARATGGQPADTLQMAQERMACRDYEGALRLLTPFAAQCDSCRAVRLLEAQCLLWLHRDLPRVEVLLSYQQESPLVLLLQAELHRGLCRFDRAIEAYQRYATVADPRLMTAAQAFLRQVDCQNAQRLCLSSLQPELLAQRAVAFEEMDLGFREMLAEGAGGPTRYSYRIIAQPRSLRIEGQVPSDTASGPGASVPFVAYPDPLRQGAQLFFSGARQGEVTPSLYAVSFLGGELWSAPALLGPVINAGRGTTMGILAEDGKTLYFSSRGHYGMGDYDIYRSVYDSLAEQWSPPVNLGFPINSPFDDYLLGLPTASDELLIASNRSTSPDSLMLYRLRCDLRRPGVLVSDPRAIVARMYFGAPGKGEKAEGDPRAKAKVTREREGTLAGSASVKPHFREVEGDPEYQQAIAKGFQLQAQVDSIRNRLTPLKGRMDRSRTVEELKTLEARVRALEKEMVALQRQADRQFAQASSIEREYLSGRRTLSHGQAGQAQFAQDQIEHLYQSQLASTVFQQDELRTLGKVAEKRSALAQEDGAFHTLEMENLRLMQDSAVPLAVLVQAEERAELAARALVGKYDAGIKLVQGLYQQCLPVAMVKSGMRNASLVKAAERKANECYFKAKAITNAGQGRTSGQSQCLAMLHTLLGNDYLELGFTYAWGLEDYQKRVTQRVERLSARLAEGLGQGLKRGENAVLESRAVSQKPSEAPLHPSAQAAVPTTLRGELGGAAKPSGAVPTMSIAPGSSPAEGLQISSPNPYSAESPVPTDQPLPGGVVYRWQLGAYSNPIDPALFRGLNPVFAERVEGGRITKYYAGDFRRIESARLGKAAVQSCGFPDAFLVAWYNGRSISLGRAQALEDDAAVVAAPTGKGNTSSTGTPDLGGMYRVFLGHFGAALPAHIAETIALLAPGKHVVRQEGDGAQWGYSLGDFSSPRDAERVRDNLLASGLVEARIEPMGKAETPSRN